MCVHAGTSSLLEKEKKCIGLYSIHCKCKGNAVGRPIL